MTNGKSEVEVGFTGTSSPIAKGRSDGRNWEESSSFMHIEFAIGPERPPAAWVILREVRDGEGGVGYMRQDLHAEVVVDQESGRKPGAPADGIPKLEQHHIENAVEKFRHKCKRSAGSP